MSEEQKLADQIAYIKDLHVKGETEKIHKTVSGRYIKDVVYGANDGIVTTFAVVSGVAGASLSIETVLILGIANLIADGISMGASNFLGSKSEEDYYKKEKAAEYWEVDHLPDHERQEIRDIYAKKGFTGAELEEVVDVITKNKDRWVDVMMKEELGLIEEPDGKAFRSGLVTFISFVVAGFMPLASYIFFAHFTNPFFISVAITALTLFVVGAMRSLMIRKVWWKAGLEMLMVGVLAAGAAYGIGFLLRGLK